MKYAVVIEKAQDNHSAYVPDLPGCVATGGTLEEVESEMREAIAFHIEGMREDGLQIPALTSQVEYIELAAQCRRRLIHHSSGITPFDFSRPVISFWPLPHPNEVSRSTQTMMNASSSRPRQLA